MKNTIKILTVGILLINFSIFTISNYGLSTNERPPIAFEIDK